MLRYLPLLLQLALMIYCLVDIAQSKDEDVRGVPRLVWILLVVVLPLAGAAAWFIVGRPKNRPFLRRPTPQDRPIAPEDDPTFMRGLDRGAPPPDRRRGPDREPGTGNPDTPEDPPAPTR